MPFRRHGARQVIDPNSGFVREMGIDQMANVLDNNGQGGVLLQAGGEAPSRIRVYDRIDGTNFETSQRNVVTYDYLQKIVFRCSCCTFTSTWEGDIAKHYQSVMESYKSHDDAKMTVDGSDVNGQPILRCTGCYQTFSHRRNGGVKHLAFVAASGPQHQGNVEEQLVYRFALTPGEPVVVKKTLIAEASAVATLPSTQEPEVNPEGRKRRRRNRNRRRR